MEVRLHQWLQVPLDHRLCNPIRYGRYAQPSLATVLLRYCYRPDRRREVRPRRHAVPNLVEVVLQVPLELLDRFRIDSGCSFVCPDPFVCLPYLLPGDTKRLCSVGRLLPPSWLTLLPRWMTRPLRSVRFPELPRYYGSLRPCASHRYSHPRGSTTWISPLASRRQVPTFHTRAWSRVTPPLCRVPPSQAAGSRWTRPGPTTRPGFDTIPTLSTRSRWFIRFVSTGPYLTRSCRAFSRDAHHHGSLPQQLTVVCSLPLPAGSEGPSLIPCAARLRSGDRLGLLSAPTWHTIIGVTNQLHVRATPSRVTPLLPRRIQRVEIDVGQKR